MFWKTHFFIFFENQKNGFFKKQRKMSRFKPSRRVERVGREISVLKSGLNISGDLF